jgi:primosomal protein N' (replication factor Y)
MSADRRAEAAGKKGTGFKRFAQVALPVPLHRSFSYGVPNGLAQVRPGCRVRVRFGTRVLVGCVVDTSDEAPELPPGTKLQPLLRLVDMEPVLSPVLLSLAGWIADYYVSPPGEVFHALLPPETPRQEATRYQRTNKATGTELRPGSLRARTLAALEQPMTARALSRKLESKQVSRALKYLVDEGYARPLEGRPTGHRPRILAAGITEGGKRALETENLRPNAVRVLTLLATATDPVPLRTIRNELKLKRGPFESLIRKGYIRLAKQTVSRSPWLRLDSEAGPPLSPTPAQRSAIETIESAVKRRAFFPLVLYGVTGSGKTEVYLRGVEAALASGRSALILVPEIALTPRLAGLLRGRFGGHVAILHSALGTGERRDEWWRVREGAARVVVGARAAALAPIEKLGLVVVDEEQETTYKQEETPRYNARDVAIKRAKDEGAVVVLGSATPSLNSYAHAMEKRYSLLSLPERIHGRALAEVHLIDMKEVVREEGPETILSRELREALEDRFSAGEQALILLNRRGYTSQLVCRQCGLAANCSECSVALTLHQKGSLAVCHYCGLGRPTPERCDVCRGEYFRHRGYGTERVEEVVKRLFDGIHAARMDRDTMRRKGSHEALLARFAAGKLDVLVGTQMLAKGHDFPAVTLVGVLAADAGLGLPDFRAAERTFQLLTQVAGRAGRGERPGEVLIQTFSPDHYSLQHACAQDYEGFYNEEMRFRRGLEYPPIVSLANLIFEGEEMREATRNARRVAETLKKHPLQGVKVLGPAFAARSKVAGRYRCQVLIKVPRRQHPKVRRILRTLVEDPTLGRTMLIDIDPLNLS